MKQQYLTQTKFWFWLITASWLVTNFYLLFFKPVSPDIDQPHYLSVAWEMFTHHSFLHPTTAGLPDHNKPPLLYWLFMSEWALTGPNSWWPRVLEILISWFCIIQASLLTQRISRAEKQFYTTAILLYGCFYWLEFSSYIRFDSLFAGLTLLSLYSQARFFEGKNIIWLVCLCLAVSLGMLTKGPMILLYTLVFSLGYKTTDRSYHLKSRAVSILTILLGLLPTIAWLSTYHHSASQRNFSLDNMSNFVLSYMHLAFNIPHYILGLILMTLPWSVLPIVWKSAYQRYRSLDRTDFNFLIIILTGLIYFGLFISHQAFRYILTPFFLTAGWLSVQIARQSQHTSMTSPGSLTLFNQYIIIACSIVIISIHFLSDKISPSFKFLTHLSPWVLLPLAVTFILLIWGKKQALNVQLSITALSSVLIYGTIIGSFYTVAAPSLSWIPLANIVHHYSQRGPILNTTGDIEPTRIEFLARLPQALPTTFSKESTHHWAQRHPGGYILLKVMTKNTPSLSPQFIHTMKTSKKLSNLYKHKELHLYGLCPSKAYMNQRCPFNKQSPPST